MLRKVSKTMLNEAILLCDEASDASTAGNPDLPRDLEDQVFAYFNKLAENRQERGATEEAPEDETDAEAMDEATSASA